MIAQPSFWISIKALRPLQQPRLSCRTADAEAQARTAVAGYFDTQVYSFRDLESSHGPAELTVWRIAEVTRTMMEKEKEDGEDEEQEG